MVVLLLATKLYINWLINLKKFLDNCVKSRFKVYVLLGTCWSFQPKSEYNENNYFLSLSGQTYIIFQVYVIFEVVTFFHIAGRHRHSGFKKSPCQEGVGGKW